MTTGLHAGIAKEKDAFLGHEAVQRHVAFLDGQASRKLELEPDPDRGSLPRNQRRIVESSPVPQAVPGEGEGGPRHQDEIRAGNGHFPARSRNGFRNTEGPADEPFHAGNAIELEAPLPRHARKGQHLPLSQRGVDDASRVGFAPHRNVGENHVAELEGREPADPACDAPGLPRTQPCRLTEASFKKGPAHGLLQRASGRRHRHDFTIVIVAISMLNSGCLPFLLGTAETLRPGEYSLAVAGAGRSRDLPASIEQAGPAAAMVEIRGGLVRKGLEAGMTAQIPVHAVWDIKWQFLEQKGDFLPAIAFRFHLGAYQADTGSLGGSLLATRNIGRVSLTAMTGFERTNERLWPQGASPFDSASVSFVKHPIAVGLGASLKLSSRFSLFIDTVSWDSKGQEEQGDEWEPLDVSEGRTWFFAGGLKLNWTRRLKPAPQASLTALRGWVMKTPDDGRFEVGQPGIYTAIVYMDSATEILSGGVSADLSEIREGRAVLIQGLPLPRPAAFLARTIELQ